MAPTVVSDAPPVTNGRRIAAGSLPRPLNRQNASMRIERSRENVFTVTATSQELSASVAGARMAFEAMRSAPEPPPSEAVEILERVLNEFDLARVRLAGRPGRRRLTAGFGRDQPHPVIGSGRCASRRLLADIGGDLVELGGERVVVELERVQVRAPAHRVLRD